MDWTPIELKQHQRHRSHLSDRKPKAVKGWLPTLIFGTIGTVSVGVGIMEMGAGQLTELQCRRSASPLASPSPSQSISCTRTITTGLTRETPIEITNITTAKIQQVGRKFRNAYRVILVTGEQTIPLTEDFKSDKREKEQHITQINRFIRTQNPSSSEFALTEDDRAQSNLFGLMFITMGLLWILMAWVVQFSIHRKFTISRRSAVQEWD